MARALPRLVAASASGRYTGLGRGRLALMMAAAAYVVSPVDLLPEELLGPLGLVDDAAVLSWLAGTVLAETEAFLAWEAGESPPRGAGPRPKPGPVPSASGRTSPPERPRGPDVVPGEVIG